MARRIGLRCFWQAGAASSLETNFMVSISIETSRVLKIYDFNILILIFSLNLFDVKLNIIRSFCLMRNYVVAVCGIVKPHKPIV